MGTGTKSVIHKHFPFDAFFFYRLCLYLPMVFKKKKRRIAIGKCIGSERERVDVCHFFIKQITGRPNPKIENVEVKDRCGNMGILISLLVEYMDFRLCIISFWSGCFIFLLLFKIILWMDLWAMRIDVVFFFCITMASKYDGCVMR